MIQVESEVINSRKIIYPGDMIGIIGEGRSMVQLVVKAKSMGFKVATYVTSEQNEVNHYADKNFVGSVHDGEKLQRFAQRCKIVLYESELIDIKTIQYLQQFVSIPQGVKLLELNQDRIIEKASIEQLGVKTSPYVTIVDLDDLYESIAEVGYPAVLRPILKDSLTERQLVLKNEMDLPKASALLERGTYLLESMMDNDQEIAVTVIKNQNKRQKMFPMVENIYQDGLLKETKIPVDLDSRIQNNLLEIASKVTDFVEYVGAFSIVFGVKDEEIYLKRLIPGLHQSQNIFKLATNTTVDEEMLRALSGMLTSDIHLQTPTVMLNITELQMQKIKTQWLIKDNWHFHFYPQVNEAKSATSIGYILADGDDVDQIQEQIDNTDIW
jgi:5-(carboxyamino)imidazole ribonucleotide synthase